jgi:hypothetical protein
MLHGTAGPLSRLRERVGVRAAQCAYDSHAHALTPDPSAHCVAEGSLPPLECLGLIRGNNVLKVHT